MNPALRAVVRTAWQHGAEVIGIQTIFWDGKDYAGRPVASGTYVFNLIQGEFAASRRVAYVK